MTTPFYPSLLGALFLIGAAALAAPVPAGPTPAAPLNAAMSQLLRQAAAESELAADAGFDPPVVAAGGTAIYRVVVTATPDAVDLPERIPAPEELQLQKGGVGSSYVTKGLVAQYRATFNYRVAARSAGSFTIGSYDLYAGGRRVAVPSRTLSVVAPGAPEARRPPSLQVEVPEGDFYVGQAVRVQITALDPGDSSVLGLADPKALGDAFLFERLAGTQRRELRDDHGQSVSAQIEEVIAIPIRAGRLTLAAQAFVERRPATDPQSIRLPGYRPFLEAAPVDLEVKHLPGGALPGFTGLIGQFEAASPRPAVREVHAGDPFDLPIVVQGEGNLGRLLPPPIANAPGWRVVASGSHRSSPPAGGQSGSHEFHYTLIPLNPGLTATPTIPFSYFDPQQRHYVDLTIPSIPILVLRSAGAPAMALATNAASSGTNASAHPAPEGLGRLARRPVHFAAALAPAQQRAAFWRLQLLLSVALAGWQAWGRGRRYLAAHPELLRRARAWRELRRQERRRRRAARDRDPVAFAKAAVRALRAASAPHLLASPEALVGDDVLRAFPPPERDGRNGDLVRQLFLFADEITFRDKSPNPEKLWSLQPDLERLLAELRRRLW